MLISEMYIWKFIQNIVLRTQNIVNNNKYNTNRQI